MSRIEYVVTMLEILRFRLTITVDPIVALHATMQIHSLEEELRYL